MVRQGSGGSAIHVQCGGRDAQHAARAITLAPSWVHSVKYKESAPKATRTT